MWIRFSYLFKRLFLLHFLYSFLKQERGDCQGYKLSVSHLSLKFKTSYKKCCGSACSRAARNPREITISLAFLCREPSCIQKHNSPLRFFFHLYCTSICIQRGPLGLSPSAILPANEVLMTQDFAFLNVTPILFNSSQAGFGAVMSKKCGRETK